MGALFCRIELNKKDGVVITVDNQSGKIVHKIEINKDSITTTSKGSSDTSKIEQKPESVYIDCKKFKLTAETIECKASKSTLMKSDSSCDIESGKTMSINSGQKMNMGSGSVNVSADANVNISGLKIKLQ
ncbi:hypothetical protein ACJJIE_03415 [Microbulbifer sp. TRSA001]|uniref:hypothetical protein n=1 Tax=Microbulbifer sp. TRSA001 TaxID=3243381 RepID=UPI004039D9EE